MSPILRFYSGEGSDSVGRTLAEIQGLDVKRMEYYHDFIQWMFPLRQPSGYQPGSPVLTDEDVKAFLDRPDLRANLRASFVAFLAFLGLKFDAEQNEVRATNRFAVRHEVFATPNHNWLRITRVLLSLKTLGLDAECRAFFAFLDDLYKEGVGITDMTFAYWRDAAEGKTRS